MRKRILLFAAAAVFLVACSNGGTPGGNGGNGNGDGNGNGGGGGTAAIMADHLAAAAFGNIPASYISQAISNFRIFYGHTSHGSQIITGLQMLQSSTYNYAGMSIEENDGLDLGHNGDTTWADTTRTRLNQVGSNINLVMWSWCGGVLHHGVADTDACQWCSTWCGSHTCGPYAISCTNDADCAHSHCFNCYLKGKAFWWLLARMAGWSG